VYGEHKARLGIGAHGAGGFVDVGANIGDVSSEILHLFGGQSRLIYAHYLGSLTDAEHPPPSSNDKVPFLLSLEASPATLQLLERRAEAEAWAGGNARILRAAAANSTGSATFYFLGAGSEKSGLAVGGEGKDETTDGVRTCSQVPTASLTDLLNKEHSEKSRVFFLKIVSCVCVCENFPPKILSSSSPPFFF